MFGLRTKKPETTEVVAVDPLDRIDRRIPAEPRPVPGAADRDGRMIAASAGLRDAVAPRLQMLIQAGIPAGEVTRQAGALSQAHFRSHGVMLAPLELRRHVADVLRPILPATNFGAPTVGASVDAPPEPETAIGMASAIKAPVLSERPQPAPAAVKTEPFGRSAALQAASLVKSEPDDKLDDNSSSKLSRSKVDQARRAVQAMVMTRIDLAAAVSMPRSELVRQLEGLAAELLAEHRIQLNRPEQTDLVHQLVNDMMGLGPLEPLLADDGITDIMINGPSRDYRSLNALGVVLDMQGRHADAQAKYRQGIEVAPDFLPLRNNFALSLAISGNPQEAIAQLVPITNSRAADGRVRQNLAFSYAMAGDLENALQVSRKDLDEASAQRQLSYFMQLKALPPEARSAELRRNPNFFPQSGGGGGG